MVRFLVARPFKPSWERHCFIKKGADLLRFESISSSEESSANCASLPRFEALARSTARASSHSDGPDDLAQPPLPDAIVTTPPPAPLVETAPPPPFPGYAWDPGLWTWDGAQYVWEPGRYIVQPTNGATFIPGYWRQYSGGRAWVDGRWNWETQGE